MKKIHIYTTVAICGAAVLALEILGTRILGPFYGVSIFLWSALITITLAALSLGYLIGGHLADKNPSPKFFYYIIGLSGIWILFIPLIKHPFLEFAEPFGLRTAVLVASFILFFPPLTLLGMVSPYAIKLKLETVEKAGRTAGTLYAISTFASVFSALLTGFLLIPNIGVNRLTYIVGILLVVTSVYGLFMIKRRILGSILFIITILFSVFIWDATAEAVDDYNLKSIEQSRYAEIRIVDADEIRYLLIDGGIHSAADTNTWVSITHYAAVMDLPKYFFTKPGRALLIGLGGGSLLKQYKTEGWLVDAVEIDPAIIKIAHKYFGLSDDEGNIIEMDGRQFLKISQEKYDVILLDAFGSSSVPSHLVTAESFKLMANRLTENGILALNIETVGWNDPIIAILCSTLKLHFSDIIVLPMEEPPDQVGNIVILASNRKLEPLREPEYNVTFNPEWRYGPGYQKRHAWDNKFIPNLDGIQILTDDLNSFDIISENINVEVRKRLHSFFKESRINVSW